MFDKKVHNMTNYNHEFSWDDLNFFPAEFVFVLVKF